MKTAAAQASAFRGARTSSPAAFGVPPNKFPANPRLHDFSNRSGDFLRHETTLTQLNPSRLQDENI
jgi:hypothetical protein